MGEEAGLEALLQYPLLSAIMHRRSRRVSQGVGTVRAGSLTYESTGAAQPLTPLEEALLIVATGTTGITMHDLPFQTSTGQDMMGTPMLRITGRSASSPDNAQSTHFFLMNDDGTYFLREPPDLDPFEFSRGALTAERLVAYADRCKVKVLDHRLDFPREFPCYLNTNPYLSNVPGSTILIPIVDLTKQYINGFMYVLSQDDGYRPCFLDDWNFYKSAGVKKWVRSGFLNKNIPLPIGLLGSFRNHIEADLIMQNLLLVIQAMGLGGWIHAAFYGPLLLGDPEYARYGPGLKFRHARPTRKLRSLLRFITPLPAWRPNPVGLDGIIEGHCPPYYPDMSSAVDSLVAEKYGTEGIYTKPGRLDESFKPGVADRFRQEVPHYTEEVIACTKAICNYIYDTYGRFPAHVDAMYVPGVWVQAHHLDLEYYDRFFVNGYSQSQADHQRLWHADA